MKFVLAHKHLRFMVALTWQRLALCLGEVVLLSWLLFTSAVLTPSCAGISVLVVNCAYRRVA